MGLEALVEVVCAHTGRNDGEDEQQDGENGKGRERLAGGLVIFLASGVGNVHADELEQEVAHGDEVDDNNAHHAGKRLAADPPSGQEQKKEGDDERGGREGLFDSLGVFDHYEKLDGKGKEEEKVKLQESNVNLQKVSPALARGWCGSGCT